jgi:hypothetical protein
VTNLYFIIAVFFRKKIEVTEKGVTYNWDNRGFTLKYYNFCKYGVNLSGNKNFRLSGKSYKKVETYISFELHLG